MKLLDQFFLEELIISRKIMKASRNYSWDHLVSMTEQAYRALFVEHNNIPLTRSGGKDSVLLIMWTIRNSSAFAAGECLKVSMGIPSWPGAFPLLRASRHSSSSWLVILSSGLAVCSRLRCKSAGGEENFLAKKAFQAEHSWSVDIIRSPERSLDGIIVGLAILPLRILVKICSIYINFFKIQIYFL